MATTPVFLPGDSHGQRTLEGCSPQEHDWAIKFRFHSLKYRQRANALVKTLMLRMTEGKRRRGRQRMRWSDGIANSVDMKLSNLQERVENRKAGCAAVHEVTKSLAQHSGWTTTYLYIWETRCGKVFSYIPTPWASACSETPNPYSKSNSWLKTREASDL